MPLLSGVPLEKFHVGVSPLHEWPPAVKFMLPWYRRVFDTLGATLINPESHHQVFRFKTGALVFALELELDFTSIKPPCQLLLT